MLLLLLVLGGIGEAVTRCERGPGDGVVGPRSRPDGKFKIFLNGEPQVYNPGEMYTVTLRSLDPYFVWFSLWGEASGGNTGTLHPFGDSTTKKIVNCPALITAASSVPKQEASSLWSAPAPGSGCVTFKATVVVSQDLWYQEDGPLTYTICENQSQSNDEQPAVNQDCCACDEAKYEVGFEGLWSRQTHPKDFPDKNITRFSDVIGASHTTDYRFWDYGGIASEGLREVAELGSTRTLESELKSQSQHIRTIIKARGIAFPNVTSKTFAVFRVDRKHHLISLVSMMAPSPDWIVGVSGLELCLSNCTWIETKVLNLYPWDAGTDSGITYLSPKNRTNPKDHIRRITSSFPSDPRSPFYDPAGEPMKPLAKLYLTRQRLYEKTCNRSAESESTDACETREWGNWSPCSVTCGVGTRSRQRFYRDERKAADAGCMEELTSRISCHEPVSCSWEDEGDEAERERKCEFTPWSPWSTCSVACGKGQRYRFRRLLNKRNWKDCMFVAKPPKINEEEECEGVKCNEEFPPMPVNCTVGPWSEWSACSVSCGQGKRVRERQLAGSGCDELPKQQDIFCIDLPGCVLSPEQAKEEFLQNSSEKLGNLEIGSSNNIGDGGLFGEIKPASFLGTIEPVTGVDGPVVDCRVSGWSDWGPCSATCGHGWKKKTRRIIKNARNGGRACPRKLLKTRKCHLRQCAGLMMREEPAFRDYEDDEARRECVYLDWTAWSSCKPACGLNSIQERTREVDRRRSPPNLICTGQMETRVCNILPCHY